MSRIWQPRDKPPPSKRPRLSSTPSSSCSVQPPSSSSSVNDLRLESSSRLFQFWDQLAGRYNKPLDEDDIVDLRELKIIKDRGITRSAASSYSIGSLLVPEADPEDARSEGADTEEGDAAGDAEGEGEDSADELDLISPPAVPVKLEYYKTWYVPPADETNPEDAEAFREFEEAERKRRELYGDVDEEDEEIVVAGLEEGGHDPSDNLEQADEQEVDGALEDEQEDPSPSPKPAPRRRKSKSPKPADDESSEDELAAWEIDNTPIPPRRSVPPRDDIIDLTISRSPSPEHAPRGRSQSRPPRVQNREPSRARSKSRPPAQPAGKTPERPSSPEQVLQLLTPPRSSSSTVDSARTSQQGKSPASRAETPSPKLPKARPRYTPRPRPLIEDDDDVQERLPTLNLSGRTASQHPFAVGPPRKAKKKLRPKPEVVITTSPRRLNGRNATIRPPSPEPASSPSMAAVKRKSAKGKEKETSTAGPSKPASAKASKAARSQSQPRGSTREQTAGSSSPQPPPPSRGRKRRRVSSLSSMSDGSPAKAVTPELPPAVSSAIRKQPSARGSSRSGYSSDIPPPTSSPVRTDDEDGMLRRLSDYVSVLKRIIQKNLPNLRTGATPEREVSSPHKGRRFARYTHMYSLRIPHDMMKLARLRVAVIAIMTGMNDIRRFLPFKTRRHNTPWLRHGTVCHISWLREPFNLRHPRRCLVTLQVFHSRQHHGHPTPPAIVGTIPCHRTFWTRHPPKPVLLDPRHILLRDTIRIPTHTRMTPASRTVRSRRPRRSLRRLPTRRRFSAPHPCRPDSAAAPGAGAFRSSWTTTIDRCRPPHPRSMKKWRAMTSRCRCLRGGAARAPRLLRLLHQGKHLPRRERGKLGPKLLAAKRKRRARMSGPVEGAPLRRGRVRLARPRSARGA